MAKGVGMLIPRIVSVSLFFLTLASVGSAQLVPVTNATSTPLPGSGHDYIGMLDETVNPANGSVSLRIRTPVPGGRGFSLPFSFNYDSNFVNVLDSQGAGGGWIRWLGSSGLLYSGGWSYAVPLMSKTIFTASGQDSQFNPISCDYFTNYMFQDVNGVKQSIWGLVQTIQGDCTDLQIFNETSGGNEFYQAYLPGDFPRLVGLDGTVYEFPKDGGNFGFTSEILTVPPNWIQDRNGNRININFNSSTDGFSYMDTLGRAVVSSSGFGTSGNTVSISGLPSPYTTTWGTTPSNFSLGFSRLRFNKHDDCFGIGSQTAGRQVITAIQLPNQQQYQFEYEPKYGLISKVIYPTGAYVSYTWDVIPRSLGIEFPSFPHEPDPNDPDRTPPSGKCFFQYDWYGVSHRYVSVDGQTIAFQQDFSYVTNSDPIYGGWNTKSTTVTTHDLVRGMTTTTVYNYLPGGQGGDVPVEQTVVYGDSNGSTLKTVDKTWASSVSAERDERFPQSEQVTLPNGLISKTTYKYVSLPPEFGSLVTNGLLTEKSEFDWGSGSPGPLLKNNVTKYASFPATPLFTGGPSISNRSCQDLTYDGSGNIAAETDYYYDNGATGPPCGIPGVPSVSPVSNLPSGSHDETNYDASSTTPRGNVTTEVHKCFVPGSSQTCPDSVVNYNYDETGQLLSKSDTLGHITSYDYTDNFSEGGPAPGNTNAYLTRIIHPTTNGVSHIESSTYSYLDGKVMSATDQNQQTTTYKYDDPFRRLRSVTGPPDPNNGGQRSQAIYNYDDSVTAFSPNMNVQQTIDGRQTLTWTLFDGLGRAIRTAQVNDEDSSNPYDQTDTCFNGLGQVYFSSYAYRSTGFDAPYSCQNPQAPSRPGDTSAFDALGRQIQITNADGSIVSTDYSQFPIVIVTDQTGRKRRSQTDGLGHITTVWEPDALGNFAYETDYKYDTLDNLIHVDQKGGSTDPSLWRKRDFTYDSLAQLITAVDPESGTINYTYDGTGNLTSRTSPAPNQTNAAVTTTYRFGYDELDRLIWRWNINQPSTPVDRFLYDVNSAWGKTVHNSVGRLVLSQSDGAANGSVATIRSYDLMGRTEFEIQYPNRHDNTVSQQFSYAYNLDGSIKSITYPSGRRIDYGYNRAQRPISAKDLADGINYYTAGHYTPFGAVSSMVYGATPGFSGIAWNNSYNTRMQPCRLVASASPIVTSSNPCSDSRNLGNILDVGYDYSSCANGGDNGDLCQFINGKDHSRNQSFTYDALNRLLTVSSTPWSESFGYDPWGNLLQKNVAGNVASSEMPMSLAVTANNQATNWCYDAAGNVLSAFACPRQDNVYDAESRLIQTTVGGVTASYDYDTDGRRVSKSTGDGTLYWYGLSGEVLQETDRVGNMIAEYAFLGGRRIARLDFPNPCKITFPVHYYFADRLGSADVVTNADGSKIEAESIFYPYGGEQLVSDLGIDNHYKFTGKERDPETGLDYFGARYYGSSIGRFVTPDSPLIDQDSSDPQSWNLYSFVRNNPTTSKDEDGHLVNICEWEGNRELQCFTIWDNSQYSNAQQQDTLHAPTLSQLQECECPLAITDAKGKIVGVAQWIPDNPGIEGEQNRIAAGFIGYGSEAFIKAFVIHAVRDGVTGGVVGYAASEFLGGLLEGLGVSGQTSVLGLEGAAEAANAAERIQAARLIKQVSPEQLNKLKEFFGQGKAGAEARVANFEVPPGLSRETLLAYRRVARATIALGNDTTGVQGIRLELVRRALMGMR